MPKRTRTSQKRQERVTTFFQPKPTANYGKLVLELNKVIDMVTFKLSRRPKAAKWLLDEYAELMQKERMKFLKAREEEFTYRASRNVAKKVLKVARSALDKIHQ